MRMKIGLFGDTHDNLPLLDKALALFKREDCQILFHTGDFVAPFAVKKILGYDGQVRAVLGNNDGEVEAIRVLFGQAKETAQLQTYSLAEVVGEKRIILHHGHIPFFQDALVKSQTFDLVVSGHTHRQEVYNEGRTLVVNPGTVSGYVSGESTVVVIDTETWEPLVHTL